MRKALHPGEIPMHCFCPTRRGAGCRNRQFVLPGIALLCAASILLHDPKRVVAASLDQAGSPASAESDQKPAAPAPVQKPAVSADNLASGSPPNVLVQLNAALETLAARVSPAVVQILVSGYGPVANRKTSRTPHSS